MFYSAAPESNVVGATADLLLEIDEAQDVSPDKFDRDYRPMASTTNATTILYGTAWSDTTLLARQRAVNLELEQQSGLRLYYQHDQRTLAAINDDGVAVGLGVTVGEEVGVGLAVGAGVGDGVAVDVAMRAGVVVGVSVGTAEAVGDAGFCGSSVAGGTPLPCSAMRCGPPAALLGTTSAAARSPTRATRDSTETGSEPFVPTWWWGAATCRSTTSSTW